MPVSGIAHIRSYDLRVVALSVAIAALGAYAGLDLAERGTAARGGARVAWLIGGGTAARRQGVGRRTESPRARRLCDRRP
jgi:NO-binding membrane sensor protein with MHYT domain